MQFGATHTAAFALRERRLDTGAVISKTHAAKGMSRRVRQVDAERAGRYQSIGHDALAASLVYRRHGGIAHSHIEAAPPRCECRSQPGRAAADHADIGGARL